MVSTADFSIAERLQGVIATQYGGEQPVGTCLLVETDHAEVDLLAYCPTMRVPCDVSDTYNAYLAFRAALWIIQKDRPDVKSIVSSALCTGAGQMSPTQSAQQVSSRSTLIPKSYLTLVLMTAVFTQLPAWLWVSVDCIATSF